MSSFRRKNIALAQPGNRAAEHSTFRSTRSPIFPAKSVHDLESRPRGVRVSPIDGRLTTSTGVESLDGLLAGHGGLALGQSVLLEEGSMTDYSGVLLRLYAAEGIAQGHSVHVIGADPNWILNLPGIADSSDVEDLPQSKSGEMRIAWRYEKLKKKPESTRAEGTEADVSLPDQSNASDTSKFRHVFDLTKRLTTMMKGQTVHSIPIRSKDHENSPFESIIDILTTQMSSEPASTIHRFVFPGLLSPAFYPSHACLPQHLLGFFHSLRSLLRSFPTRVTAMLSLPLALFPRESGLVRWIELLSDGVLELTAFPPIEYLFPTESHFASAAHDDSMKGVLEVHKLPIFHERGGGRMKSAGVEDDLAFTVTRRRFIIKPFNLPPVVMGAEPHNSGRSQSIGSGLDF